MLPNRPPDRSFLQKVVPHDILLEIFSIYTRDLKKSPWTLTQVCRLWRLVALESSALWSRIHITVPRYPRIERYYDGKKICTNAKQVQRVLERARNTLLDISITFDSTPSTATRYSRQFWAIMDLLGGTRLGRLRSLSLPYQVEDMRSQWEQYFRHKDASLAHMEELHLNFACDALIDLASKTARKLKILRLAFDNPYRWSLCKSKIWLRSVVELHISDDTFNPLHYTPAGHDQVDGFAELINACPKLEILRALVPDRLVPSKHQITNHASIQTLILKSDSRSWTYFSNCATVTSLHLTLHTGRIDEPYSVQFPNLTHLKLTGAEALETIVALVCPKIEELFLEWCGPEETNDAIEKVSQYIKNSYNVDDSRYTRITPKHLHFQYVYASPRIIRQLLFCFPSVIRLEAPASSFQKAFYQMFRSKVTDLYGRRSFLLPNLQELAFRSAPPQRTSDDDMDDLYQEIVNARRKAGSPLNSLTTILPTKEHVANDVD